MIVKHSTQMASKIWNEMYLTRFHLVRHVQQQSC